MHDLMHDMQTFQIDKRPRSLRAAQQPEGVDLAIEVSDHRKALFHLSQDEAASLGHWLIAEGEAATHIAKDGV